MSGIRKRNLSIGKLIGAPVQSSQPVERGTVIDVGSGTVDVRKGDGFIMRRVPLIGSANRRDIVQLEYKGGGVQALASSAGTGGSSSGANVGATGTTPITYIGAPNSASYLLLSGDGTLTNERVFTKGNGLVASDAGSNSTYTLSVGAGTGILSNSTDVAVNTAYSFTWSNPHTFTNGLYIGADVFLSRIGANILALGSGDSFQSQGYTSGLTGWNINYDGTAEFENVRVRGELAASVFKINEMSATAGTLGVWYSAGTLFADFTTPSSVSGTGTMQAKNSDAGGMLFGVNDYLQIKSWTGAGVSNSWLRVDSRTNNTTYTSYGVTLMSGSTSAAFKAGTAIADWGPTGSGALTFSADGTIGSTANMSILTHAGAPWTTTTLRARLGNLNGSYGVSGNYYGLGIGDYSSGNYLKYDTNGGFVLRGFADGLAIDSDGLKYLTGVNSDSTIKWVSTLSGAYTQYASLRTTLITSAGPVTRAYTELVQNAAGPHEGYVILQANGTSPDFVKLTLSGVDGNITTSAPLAVTGTLSATGAVSGTDGTFTGAVNVGTPPYTSATAGDARAGGTIHAGSTSADYTPTTGNWSTAGSTLLLNAANYSTIGFHDSGARVDFIRAGAGEITIGYNGGYGAAAVKTGASLSVTGGLNIGSGSGAGTGEIQASGAGVFGGSLTANGGALNLSAATPYINIYETDQATDEKRWEVAASSSQLLFRALNDAYSAGNAWLEVNRTGTTIDSVIFGNGIVGIGTATPLGVLHVKGNNGHMMTYSNSAIGGTAVTPIADGTNDVTAGCSITGYGVTSAGGSYYVSGVIDNGAGPIDIAFNGDANALQATVSGGGALTIFRKSGGTVNWDISVTIHWR